MSEAKVEFMDIKADPCPAGEKPARFTFRCVRHNQGQHPSLPYARCANLLIAEGPYSVMHGIKRDPNCQNGGRSQWDWDGNREAPTFSPSINCESHCGWHGYIKKGRCVKANGQDSPT
jgi:hypothetical protein